MTSATMTSGGVLGRSEIGWCMECTSARLLGSEAKLLRSSSLPLVLHGGRPSVERKPQQESLSQELSSTFCSWHVLRPSPCVCAWLLHYA